MKNISIIVLLWLGWVTSSMGAGKWSVKFTSKIVDEDGAPLQGAHITARFAGEKTEGDTDTNGCFVVNAEVLSREGGFSAKKLGYYESNIGVLFSTVVDGRCQPWDPVISAVVRRVINPIPMNVKQVDSIIPVLDEYVGYDLAKGDWTTPHGIGEVSDLSICMKKRFVNIKDFDSSLDILVTNCVDGFEEASLASFKDSQFRLSRSAPLDGYEVTNMHFSESSTNYFKPNELQSYYFRVRTVTNESGQVTSAVYGKIRGYIGFDVRRKKTGTVGFTYYMNPTTNDRNLEFDPKRNLFKNLKSTEQVREP